MAERGACQHRRCDRRRNGACARRGLGWTFSPDGKQIVFARTHEQGSENFGHGKIDLFVTDVDGGTDPKQITDTGDSSYPVWGPKSIAFAKFIAPRWLGRHEIWQVQPDGSGLETITGPLPERFLGPGFTGLMPIDWSDDGRALLGAWGNEWGEIPVAVNPENGEIRELAEGLAWGTVAISSDRFALAYTYNHIDEPDEETATVVVIPFGGGKPKVVARGAGYPSWNR